MIINVYLPVLHANRPLVVFNLKQKQPHKPSAQQVLYPTFGNSKPPAISLKGLEKLKTRLKQKQDYTLAKSPFKSWIKSKWWIKRVVGKTLDFFYWLGKGLIDDIKQLFLKTKR